MTTINSSFNSVTNWFLSLPEGHQVSIHNQLCSLFNDDDNHIYVNHIDVINGLKLSTIAEGRFNLSDVYFRFDDNGKIHSFNNPLKYIDVAYLCANILHESESFDIVLENENIDI